MAWQPTLGAWRQGDLTRFRMWAPEARAVELVVGLAAGAAYPLAKTAQDFFEVSVHGLAPGVLYRYRVDGKGPYPDPASRYQPHGVHGPSQVIDAERFCWTDQDWTGIGLEQLVLYEMHIGTFTPAGTFVAAAERLPMLGDLGVTAVELMPVADFAGNRNWGYDGVALFAPARCYGTPDDLRRFVNEAHRLGLAVHLDVVYNHLGPDGAYHGVFSPYYFSERHRSPWGAGINFDGPHSGPVRRFFIENALHWIHEYHIDGLRLDATHAIVDESPRHILAELSAAVRDSMAGSRHRALVIAEDVRNLAYMVRPESEHGWGLDAVWSDDFHHEMRRCLAGDHDGYFRDFEGTTADIAETIRRGWFYCGQYAPYFCQPRGTDPAGIPPSKFVFFIQNHDQVGNRAFGDRLHHQADMAAYRAATALLLLAPETPLLFMGQEWAATTPFQFFTDHQPELGKMVTEGRRSEFERFAGFSDPKTRQRIPDPQALSTMEASRLNWQEREQEPHASVLRLHRRLLQVRQFLAGAFDVSLLDGDTLLLQRPAAVAVVRLRGSGIADLRGKPLTGCRWETLLTTEDPGLAPDPTPARIEPNGPVITFARPGAVLFRATPATLERRS